jgi:hypothetical protein
MRSAGFFMLRLATPAWVMRGNEGAEENKSGAFCLFSYIHIILEGAPDVNISLSADLHACSVEH